MQRRGRATPRPAAAADPVAPEAPGFYVLEAQVGFILRRVQQRHTSIFQEHINDLTPTQWATMVKLREAEALSQNHLGRLTAMDAATMQGVVRRLMDRGLIARRADPTDRRRLLLCLTPPGRALVEGKTAGAFAISRETLSPLLPKEREILLRLLRRLC